MRIGGEAVMRGEIVLQCEGQELTDWRLISEEYILSNNIIVAINALSTHFKQLSTLR